jgi:hypothetical protein
MDRKFLEDCLADGMSLTEIGALTNRDPSTVGYWVHKHGLIANGQAKYAPRGGLSREELEPLVESGLTLREIAAELDRSVPTVRYWIDKLGLAEPRSFRKREIDAAVEAGARTVTRRCRCHGETEFAIVGSEHRPRCKKCRAEAVARRRRKVKRLLVEESGGECALCGYDRCYDALEFHHRDPSTKSFGLAQRGVTRAIAQVREEAKKCVLLCANCHAEVEAGVGAVPLELSQAIVPSSSARITRSCGPG